jgi:hypothetical protein
MLSCATSHAAKYEMMFHDTTLWHDNMHVVACDDDDVVVLYVHCDVVVCYNTDVVVRYNIFRSEVGSRGNAECHINSLVSTGFSTS